MSTKQKTGRSCPECGTRSLYGTITVEIARDGVTIILQGVPAEVCPHCGEKYVEGEILEPMDMLVGQLLQLLGAAQERLHLKGS